MTEFLSRKTGTLGNKYNFDLQEMINNFNFNDFCRYADEESGAFVAITNKQYIIGYNSSFGDGSHIASLARVMKDISGGGKILTDYEAGTLSNEFRSKYLWGRIIYRKTKTIDSHVPHESYGSIGFDFSCNKITSLEYEMFCKFYDDFNEEIKEVCNLYNFYIVFCYVENDELKSKPLKDLDFIKEYMANNINDNIDIDDEVIINKKFNKNK